jgi:aryl-alcohol dehydrogenase-like predicted oxidoreductase
LARCATKLALGTAQLAGGYGIASIGTPSRGEVANILRVAQSSGIDTIDTAAAYGKSEDLLGGLGVTGFRIVTKLPLHARAVDVAECVGQSLRRLQVQNLAAVLIHRFEPSGATLDLLAALRAHPSVQQAGISLYYPSELEWLLASGAALDVVQVPLNVLDQRFVPWFGPLEARGIEIHVRSVFLQGLLLLEEKAVPTALAAVRPALGRLRELAATHSLPVAAILVGFASQHELIHRVVLGVDSADQLREHTDSAGCGLSTDLVAELRGLAAQDNDLLIPSRWGLG